MTWITSFYLRAFTILLQIALIISDEQGRGKPVIRQPPSDLVVLTDNVTLLCLADGTRPLSIVWKKNGHRLDTQNSKYLIQLPDGPLTIVKAQKGRDQGKYQCFVSNSVGTVLSKEANIVFPYMDSFTMPDTKVTVNQGDRVLLKCHAPNSFPDRHIQWKRKSFGSKNQPAILEILEDSHYTTNAEGNLYFSYTRHTDKGEYFCNLENHQLQKYQSRMVELIVNPVVTEKNIAPRIWNFTTKKAVENEKYELECIGYGRPVPMIKIYKLNSDVSLGRKLGNKRVVTFRPFQATDSGLYVCEASNIFGQKDTRTFYVSADVKPRWILQPSDLQADIGDTKTLSCVAKGTPAVTYSWYHNGKRLPIGPEYTMAGGNLTISPIELKEHPGMYQCKAKNIHGELLSAARLHVEQIAAGFGPGSSAPVNTHVLQGRMAELTCQPTGSPKPRVRWRNLNTDVEIINQPRFSISATGNLRIQRVLSSDGGRYECIAENNLGTARRRAELFVRAEVAITKPPQPMTAKVGMNITFNCGIEILPVLEVIFRWKKNYVSLKEDSRVYTRMKGTHTSVLYINNLRMADLGTYECKALTTVGSSDSADAQLIVTGVPGPPTEVTATGFKRNTILISWTLGRDNYSPVKHVHIQARTMFQPDKWQHMLTSTNTKSRGSAIVSLSPWASYRFRVISENGVGNSTPSRETFPWVKSLSTAPSEYPTGIKGIGTGPTEIKITWNPLPKLSQNGPNLYYNVFHRKSGSASKMVLDQVKYGTSFTVRGTEYYVQYEFKIQAGNDIGVGPLSPLHRGFTGERRPLGIPKDLQIQITSSKTATAWWRGVRTDRTVMRGKFLGYKLFIWKGKFPEKPKHAVFKTTRANNTQVRLDPFSSYLFQVVAYNNDGDGPGSNIAGPYNTPEDVPETPSSIEIKDAEMGRVNVTWDEPKKPNGVITGYVVQYKNVVGSKLLGKETEGTRRWVIIDNLAPAAIYDFYVAAKTSPGTGRFMKKRFDFSWLPTSKPEGLTITATGRKTVNLCWSTINDASIIGYKIYYWSEKDSRINRILKLEVKADKDVPISNLLPGTKYYFQVAAVNNYGAGPKTEPVNGNTDYIPTTTDVPVTTTQGNVIPDEVVTKIKTEANDINDNSPMKRNTVSSAKSHQDHRTLQYFFWTIITLILIYR